jgi:hypothetical protein
MHTSTHAQKERLSLSIVIIKYYFVVASYACMRALQWEYPNQWNRYNLAQKPARSSTAHCYITELWEYDCEYLCYMHALTASWTSGLWGCTCPCVFCIMYNARNTKGSREADQPRAIHDDGLNRKSECGAVRKDQKHYIYLPKQLAFEVLSIRGNWKVHATSNFHFVNFTHF